LRLRDGSAALKILPARDIAGAHGKSAAIICFDEIHPYKDWSLLEALQPDPTRDCLTWITSYALYNVAGAPLYDLMQVGKSGKDKKLLFSWYSGDYCTDERFADLPPLERANPSLESWIDGPQYLETQRARLLPGRFRRLHLNLPGSPEGAAFDQDAILKCVVVGRRSLPWQGGVRYLAACDMSGGSADDAVLVIFHIEDRTVVVDLVAKQLGGVPFSPRSAVSQFCMILREWKIAKVYGDAYGGQTFRKDFATYGVEYEVRTASASNLYERLEPLLNQREIELLDHPTLIEQTVGLVWKGQKITHEHNSHDDHINAVALAASVAASRFPVTICQSLSRSFSTSGPASRSARSNRRTGRCLPSRSGVTCWPTPARRRAAGAWRCVRVRSFPPGVPSTVRSRCNVAPLSHRKRSAARTCFQCPAP
jgi:hypothetical protein